VPDRDCVLRSQPRARRQLVSERQETMLDPVTEIGG
jgi:hypothetical protein